MSTKTPNYNLTKPSLSDNGDITVLDDDLDIIDTALSKKPDKPAVYTVNNFMTLDSQGNICDSGKKPSDFGDMLKSVYDTDNDGIVDNAKKLNGLTASATATTTEQADIIKMINELVTKKAPISEQGTWTPTLAGSTTAGAHTYNLQEGHYVRDGNKIFVYGRIYITAKDNAIAGNVKIAGLPFPVAFQQNFAMSVANYFGITLSSNKTQLTARADIGGSTIGLNECGGTTAGNNDIASSQVGAQFDITFSGTYMK